MNSLSYVYIVDDDDVIRAELGDALNRHGYAVRCFSSGRALLAELTDLAPGCMLLDLNMPGLGGLAVLEELLKRESAHAVIVLTGAGSVPRAVSAFRNGAIDFMEKPFAISDILAAIETALIKLHERSREQNLRNAMREKVTQLSPRERDVWKGMMRGLANKKIAHELAISVRTVETYRANLMVKLGVDTLSDVIKMGLLIEDSATPPTTMQSLAG